MNINLVYAEKSKIPYTISRFPDGQQNVTINVDKNTLKDENIIVYSRFRNFMDLEIIIATVTALKGLGVPLHIALVIPYILGARSDRKFVKGGNNYLKDVIAPILNSLDLSYIHCLDPHSDVTEAVLKNIVIEDNVHFVCNSLISLDLKDNFQIICPDAGAQKKIWKIAEIIKRPFLTAHKHRDIVTGKILSTEIPDLGENQNKDFIIIDDICDGGRTFIEIAKVIKEKNPESNCYLFVTHGIFSAGFKELNRYFKRIYTTNSYSDVSEYVVENGEEIKTNVEQINIF